MQGRLNVGNLLMLNSTLADRLKEEGARVAQQVILKLTSPDI
jgi:hypothetical protein